jgi:TonB-dependent receptor
MVFHKNQKTALQQGVKFKKSMLAMCIMALSAPSFAQDTTATQDENVEEIIVSGVRSNLQNAQEIKKNSNTFVDSISAEDIGSLPDRSVLEAMSRIPGVSIERFAAANDPDHFGVEGSGAVIRGMSATRSEFNGRDSFSANNGRGLNFQDVPPELMSGVDVYKNQSADMIEGGIGGTVSLRTRKPFDSPDRVVAVTADYSYGDLAESWTPTASGLFSDRWETSAGEFGFLINASTSQLDGVSNGIQSDAYVQYLDDYSAFPRPLDGGPNANHAGPNDIAGAERFAAEGKGVWLPSGSNASMKNDDRYRKGFAAAFQWENTDQTLMNTTQFLRSDATLSWKENTIGYQSGYDRRRATPLPGTEYTFDDDGIFQSGVITNDAGFGSNGWRARDGDDSVDARIPNHASWANPNLRVFGSQFQTATRIKETRTLVDDFSTNFKWTPSDSWEVSLDWQHISAETEDDDVAVMMAMNAIQDYDTRGDTPTLNFIEPWAGARDNNYKVDCGGREKGEVCFDANGVPIVGGPFGVAGEGTKWGGKNLPGFSDDPLGDSNYFQDINSYNWQSAMDHYERSEGDSDAARLDVTFNADGDFLSAVKAGVRFAKREQTVRSTAYNWGALFPVFAQAGGLGWADTPTVGNLNGQWEAINWGDFHRGGVLNVQGDSFLHPSEDLVRDVVKGRDLPTAGTLIDNPWEQMGKRQGVTPGSIFLPSEINITSEENKAAYVRFDFNTEAGAFPVKGNVGLRYVELVRDATGSVKYPDMRPTVAIPAGAPNPKDIAASDAYEAQQQAIIEASLGGSAVSLLPAELKPEAVAALYAQGEAGLATYQQLLATYATEVKAAQDREKAVYQQLDTVMRYRGQSGYYLSDDQAGFANNAAQFQSASSTYDAVLPSLNLAVSFTDELIGRFAFAKAIAMPDMENVRNTSTISNTTTTNQLRITPPVPPLTSQRSQIVSATVNEWTGTAGNPFLMPMESDQIDVSLEWYFAKDGSLTVTAFKKELSNFFTEGAFVRSYTNPDSGVTQEALVTGTINNGEGELQGVEFAYQQFFDMLPAPFDGLGMQFNYTYIDSKAIPNSGSLTPDNGGDIDTGARVDLSGLPLKGQSKDTFNITGMYEKNDWSFRLAYNWRSRYLLTTRDVISRYPLWNDDYGTVDGSVFYNLSDNFTVGLQMTNLTNAQTETIMILDGQGLEAGRSWFVNDRRAALVLKANF